MAQKKFLQIFTDFTKLVDNRFLKKIHTTEASIRYTLFYSLTKNAEFDPSNIMLEYPHPTLSRAKIDAFIPKRDLPGLAIELKFDRKIPSGRNTPKPQKAGKLFYDIFRLASFKKYDNQVECFFVYLTDDDMAAYLENKRNKLEDFFNLNSGESLEIDHTYVNNHSDTFVVYAGDVVNCRLVNIINSNLTSGFFLRIYEVLISG